MEKTVRVTGKGKLAVAPDTVRMNFTVTSKEKLYEKSLEASAIDKNEIVSALEPLGFSKKDFKTTYHNVDISYDYYDHPKKGRTRVLAGYACRHEMYVEFPVEKKLIGPVLSALSHCKCAPQFSINFTFSRPDEAKNLLLAKAVADSMAKAEIIAAAAGVKLGGILNIDYSWSELELLTRPVGYHPMLGSEDCLEKCMVLDEFDIESDDIDVTDTVTVTWAIEG